MTLGASAARVPEEGGTEPYSFAVAHEGGAFDQLPLLTWEQFGRHAKDRGAPLSIGSTLREQLEELDRAGALRPIAFRVPASEDFDELVFRESTDFTEWDSYPSRDDSWSGRVLFCHWQLLYLREALDLGTAEVPLDWFLDPTRRVSDFWRQWHEARREQRGALDSGSRRLMLLLVALQPRYIPIIRGTMTKVTTISRLGQQVDPYRKAVEEFDPAAVLRQTGLTTDEVKTMYEHLAGATHMRDPLERFYMLVRMLPYGERMKLRGSALAAQDGYDAAEMLRRFYFDLTEELLLAPDDRFDGTAGAWKERLFGHPPRLGFKPEDLHVELVRHHLYPHTVHVVTEGPTDELLIRGLVEALAGPVEGLGVTFSTLRGIGKARLHSEILRAAKRYTRFPILVVDREGDIERDIDILKRDGLLNDDTVFLWERSLEEDNFSDEELVQVAKSIATRRRADLQLTAERLREAYGRHREARQARHKGIGEVLIDLCRHPKHGSVVLSKAELAGGLRDLVLDDLRAGADEDDLVERRPVMRIVFGIVRAI